MPFIPLRDSSFKNILNKTNEMYSKIQISRTMHFYFLIFHFTLYFKNLIFFLTRVKNKPNLQYFVPWWTYLTILFRYLLEDKSWESYCDNIPHNTGLLHSNIFWEKKFNSNTFNPSVYFIKKNLIRFNPVFKKQKTLLQKIINKYRFLYYIYWQMAQHNKTCNKEVTR